MFSLSCYLMSGMTLNIFVLRKYRGIFELCHYFIVLLSTSGAISVKPGRKGFALSYTLQSVKFSYSTKGFIIFVILVFIFSFVFDHNCTFDEIILFPCRIITLLKNPIEGRHCTENDNMELGLSAYVNCFC